MPSAGKSSHPRYRVYLTVHRGIPYFRISYPTICTHRLADETSEQHPFHRHRTTQDRCAFAEDSVLVCATESSGIRQHMETWNQGHAASSGTGKNTGHRQVHTFCTPQIVRKQ